MGQGEGGADLKRLAESKALVLDLLNLRLFSKGNTMGADRYMMYSKILFEKKTSAA